MKRIALASLLLAALASTAGAATYNVGGGTPLSFAFQNASGGDIINVASGTYSRDSIRTTNAGSAGNFIRIIGNPADTAAVNLTGGAVVITKDYVSLNGFHITAGGITINASHDSVTSCMADSGGLVIEGAVTAGDTTTNNRSFNVVYNTTFKCGVIAAGGSAYASRIRCASDGVLNRVRIFATTINANADSRGRYFYGARRFTITDCKFVYEVWGNANGEQYTTGIRDRSQYNVFVRDTVWVGMKSSGSRPLLVSQSGSFGSSALNNTWYACDYRSKVQPDANDAFVYAQDGLLSARFYYCLFADSSGTPFNANSGSNGVFQNCTFFSGTSPKVWLAAVSNPSATRLGGCVFASPATATCPGTWAANSLLTPATTASIGADSNYFACADTAKLQGAVSGNTCGKTLKDWVAATNDDSHSKEAVYAAGSFTNTTWGALDLRPPAGSPLISANAPGGYFGALASPSFGPWTITASAGASGSISPSGVTTVADGASQAFTITPQSGYHVSDVVVDGVSVGALSAYTFTSVSVGHSIYAAFLANTPASTPNITACPCTVHH